MPHILRWIRPRRTGRATLRPGTPRSALPPARRAAGARSCSRLRMHRGQSLCQPRAHVTAEGETFRPDRRACGRAQSTSARRGRAERARRTRSRTAWAASSMRPALRVRARRRHIGSRSTKAMGQPERRRRGRTANCSSRSAVSPELVIDVREHGHQLKVSRRLRARAGCAPGPLNPTRRTARRRRAHRGGSQMVLCG